MALKYQAEIDQRTLLAQCPESGTPPDNLSAYRFVYSPINHKLNFLPNIIFDKKIGIGFDYVNAEENVYCSRCGISLYDTLPNAQKAWKKLAPKIKENLGYSHIANGTLVQNDGVMKEIQNNGHFGFYEDINANLPLKFKIIEIL
jgi:hypothetical protein